jgi:hypothetical protein
VADILCKLQGGDLRSIGRADEVVAEMLEDLDLFGAAYCGMWSKDPIVRMRAADVVEKVSAAHPECLQPYKEDLLYRVATIDQQEVRWHVAQMLPRLDLDVKEREIAVDILLGYLDDQSQIVKTFAMQALAEFALADESLRSRVVPILRELTVTGSPAMASRGRKLLAQLGA